jgi:transcriptional regulator with XRE-family HTH domain
MAIMIKLGSAARSLRESLGLRQKDVADRLGISTVYLCNIENDKANPSPALLQKYREKWGIDLYVLAWCLYGDVERLPAGVRKQAAALAHAWKRQLDALRKRRENESACST